MEIIIDGIDMKSMEYVKISKITFCFIPRTGIRTHYSVDC